MRAAICAEKFSNAERSLPMTSKNVSSSLGAQARLRLVFLKALFSRCPMAVVNRWETEQFRQAVNRAAGIDVRVRLDDKELSQASRMYFEKVRAEWIES